MTIIQLLSVSGEIVLQFVQLLLGAHQAKFVTAAEYRGVDVIEILANLGEQVCPPLFAPESLLAMRVPIGRLCQGGSSQ
jgi:hypothetical protein